MNASDFIFPMRAYCFPSLTVKIQHLMDLPGGPAVRILPSKARGGSAGSIPGWAGKIPPVLWPKNPTKQ